jgi:hypothetical protein
MIIPYLDDLDRPALTDTIPLVDDDGSPFGLFGTSRRANRTVVLGTPFNLRHQRILSEMSAGPHSIQKSVNRTITITKPRRSDVPSKDGTSDYIETSNEEERNQQALEKAKSEHPHLHLDMSDSEFDEWYNEEQHKADLECLELADQCRQKINEVVIAKTKKYEKLTAFMKQNNKAAQERELKQQEIRSEFTERLQTLQVNMEKLSKMKFNEEEVRAKVLA